MSPAYIIGIAVVVLIVVIAIRQRSGPRITTFERRRESDEGEKDE